MKKFFALLLAALVVLSMAACGSNNDNGKNNDEPETTVNPMAAISGTYVMDTFTENGEAVAEEMMQLYTGSKYILKDDGTCVYCMTMFGTEIETNGTFTLKDNTLTITLGGGDEDDVVMDFVVDGDTITFTEEVGDVTTVQTYKKEA